MGWRWLICVGLIMLSIPALRAGDPYDCDFERALPDGCPWTTSTNNMLYQWQRVQAGKLRNGTGPSQDSTGSSTGYFGNLQVLKDRLNAKAWLVSSVMKFVAPTDQCSLHLSYSLYKDLPVYCANKAGESVCSKYYSYQSRVCDPTQPSYYAYMKDSCAKVCGIGCGQLKVLVSGATTDEIVLYHLQQSNNKEWTQLNMTIPEVYTSDEMQIGIEATAGYDIDSYIAIDGIYFTGCNMTETNRPVEVTSTAPTTIGMPSTKDEVTPTTSVSTTTTVQPCPTTTTGTTTTAKPCPTTTTSTTTTVQPCPTTTKTKLMPTMWATGDVSALYDDAPSTATCPTGYYVSECSCHDDSLCDGTRFSADVSQCVALKRFGDGQGTVAVAKCRYIGERKPVVVEHAVKHWETITCPAQYTMESCVLFDPFTPHRNSKAHLIKTHDKQRLTCGWKENIYDGRYLYVHISAMCMEQP